MWLENDLHGKVVEKKGSHHVGIPRQTGAVPRLEVEHHLPNEFESFGVT